MTAPFPPRCPACGGTQKVQTDDGAPVPCNRCTCTECGEVLPAEWEPCKACGAGSDAEAEQDHAEEMADARALDQRIDEREERSW